jgi:PHD/YefM family antitoxin component YafN of YafNO toxin-antitoxin module
MPSRVGRRGEYITNGADPHLITAFEDSPRPPERRRCGVEKNFYRAPPQEFIGFCNEGENFLYCFEHDEAIMDTIRVTEGEFQSAFDALSDRALQEPVTITKEGRDHLVVLSADEYARLKRRDRRAGLSSELPEEWVEAVRNAKVPDEFAGLDAELK